MWYSRLSERGVACFLLDMMRARMCDAPARYSSDRERFAPFPAAIPSGYLQGWYADASDAITRSDRSSGTIICR